MDPSKWSSWAVLVLLVVLTVLTGHLLVRVEALESIVANEEGFNAD